jgi:hypothetical protein
MDENERHQRIFNEFDFYFSIKAVLDKKKLSCLVLKPTAASGNKPATGTDSLTLWAIIYQLNDEYSGTPVFNSIPGSNKIWIPITHRQVEDKPLLEKILLSYGFQLTPETRQAEVLTISDTND